MKTRKIEGDYSFDFLNWCISQDRLQYIFDGDEKGEDVYHYHLYSETLSNVIDSIANKRLRCSTAGSKNLNEALDRMEASSKKLIEALAAIKQLK